MNKAIFIDKDGTLIQDVPYNVSPDKIVLASDCIDGLRALKEAGYLLIVVSNQSGVARGFFKEAALITVEETINKYLQPFGIRLDGFYYCPHHPEGSEKEYTRSCDCRKPEAGLLLKAATEHHIDLTASWMIGDILNDVEAGNRAGCKTVLIDNGNETEWVLSELRAPAQKVKSINEAASFILQFETV